MAQYQEPSSKAERDKERKARRRDERQAAKSQRIRANVARSNQNRNAVQSQTAPARTRPARTRPAVVVTSQRTIPRRTVEPAPVDTVARESTVARPPAPRHEAHLDTKRICNKLAVGNAVALASQLIDSFGARGSSQRAVMDAFCACLEEQVLASSAPTPSTIAAYAAVVRVIQLDRGNAAAAPVYHFVASRLTGCGWEDRGVNTGLLLSSLLRLHSCSATLVFSFLDVAIAASAIDAAAATVRDCGERLRADAPQRLSQLAAAARGSGTAGVRAEVLHDVLVSVAAGRAVAATMTGVTEESVIKQLNEAVLQWIVARATDLTQRAAKRAATTQHVLDVTFEACVHAAQPRWYETRMAVAPTEAPTDAPAVRPADVERAMEKEAVGQRFSTELRRRIFGAVQLSLDDVDCFQRLLQLGALRALHDTCAVLVQCAVQSETVTPLYGQVLLRIVSAEKKARATVQFSIWDRFKQFETAGDTDLAGFINLAALMVDCICQNVLDISVLRGLDLDRGVTKNAGLFLRVFLLRLLLTLPSKAIGDFFFGSQTADIAPSQQQMRRALRLFARRFFADDDEAKRWMPHVIDVVAAPRAITEADVATLPTKIRVMLKGLDNV